MNKLNHLAIIMDGNGRWAKNRGFLRSKGHEEGVKVVQNICEVCLENDIKILSLYAFSTENWKRPKSEIDFLMKLLHKFLISSRDSFIKNEILFNTIGDMSVFSLGIKDEIENLKELTCKNEKLKLNLAINYGSKDEIVRAVKKIVTQNEEINEDNLKNALDEREDIDILVRTGGEYRLSNFMLLQASYAELFFTDTLWPDFTKDELCEILQKFSNKERRFGGV